MKDLVISPQRIRREIRILAACVLLALLTNVGTIIAYKTLWVELLTTWRITLALAFGFYAIFSLTRLAWAGLKRLF